MHERNVWQGSQALQHRIWSALNLSKWGRREKKENEHFLIILALISVESECLTLHARNMRWQGDLSIACSQTRRFLLEYFDCLQNNVGSRLNHVVSYTSLNNNAAFSTLRQKFRCTCIYSGSSQAFCVRPTTNSNVLWLWCYFLQVFGMPPLPRPRYSHRFLDSSRLLKFY